MASFSAEVLFKSVVDETSYKRALNRINQVANIAANIKPISLFDQVGSKETLKQVNKQLEKIVEAAGAIERGAGPGKGSPTLAGATQQAQLLSTALANVNLQTREGQEEVQQIARGFAAAAERAEQLDRVFTNFTNNARQNVARQQGTLTPEIQQALGPSTAGTDQDAEINRLLNERAQTVQDGIDKAADAEIKYRKDINDIAERAIKENAAREAAEQDKLTKQKISDADRVANAELQASREANNKALQNFDKRLKARARLREDLQLGLGFPLLFGGGAGSVLGGGIGALAGQGAGGFGAQILASAFGQVVDSTIESVNNLGKAFSEGKNLVKAFESAIGNLSSTQSEYINTLEKSGQLEAARAALVAAAAEEYGIFGSVLLDNSKKALEFDSVLKGLFATIKSTAASPFRIFNPDYALSTPESRRENVGESLSPTASRRIFDSTLDLENERLLNNALKERVELDRRLKDGSADRLADAEKLAAVQQQSVQAEKIEANLKLTPAEKLLELGKLNLKTEQEIDVIEQRRIANNRKIAQEKANAAAETARAAAKEAQLEAVEARRLANATKTTVQAIATANLKDIDLRIRDTELFEGEEAALKKQLELLDARFKAQEALAIEQDLAIRQTLLGTEYENQINEIIQRRKELRQDENGILEDTIKRKLALIELEKALAVPRLLQDTQSTGQRGAQSLNERRAAAAGFETQERLDDTKELREIMEDIAAIQGSATLDQGIAEQNRLRELEQTKALRESYLELAATVNTTVADAMTTALVDTITTAIQGTEDLGEKLQALASDLLGTLGRIFINAGISGLAGPGGLFGAKGLPGFRADGGPVTASQPYIIGERGPELFVPGNSGTVVSNEALARYNGGNTARGGGSRTIHFQSEIINNVEYVTADQAMAMSRAAADDGAKRGAAGGHAKTMNTLQNNRSSRARIGMR